jgi:glycosyltransferase involved in cell wall biosynthesis
VPLLAGIPDIALVSLGTTPGLVRSDESFAELVRQAGATCEVVRVRIGAAGKLRRRMAVTDLVEAVAARRSAAGVRARAVVYSTITAALFQRPELPYAIRYDATAALNRPGVGGAWQRETERGVLARARVLMPVSHGAEEATPAHPHVVRLPIPIEPIAGAAKRDIDAVAYAGYPRKRGLEVLAYAWRMHARPPMRLVIGGVDAAKGRRWLQRTGTPEPPGIEWAGELPREEWLERVGRARLYLNASRWEDYGLGPLEALSAGTPVVTVPTAGSFEALPLARELAPGLVSEDLTVALRHGLALSAGERRDYAERASELLRPYRPVAVLATLRERVLPELLP